MKHELINSTDLSLQLMGGKVKYWMEFMFYWDIENMQAKKKY